MKILKAKQLPTKKDFTHKERCKNCDPGCKHTTDILKCLSCGGKIKLTKETFILGFDAEYIKCPHCKKKIDVQNYHMNGEKW